MNENLNLLESKSNFEKIKLFVQNKIKFLVLIILSFTFIIIGIFYFNDVQKSKQIKLSEDYNNLTIQYNLTKNKNLKSEFFEIIEKKDTTYSPLALYFVIDNDLKYSKKEINKYFDFLIDNLNTNKENIYLIIYKKGLFNSEFKEENELLNILKPVLNSDSEWKVHSLYLLAEFFYSKKENTKAKEFYLKILDEKKASNQMKFDIEKRLTRDLSE
tara:strand:+ start:238 stop:882 length:645 start_codon:yes stop_codon:yes gene_type:complete